MSCTFSQHSQHFFSLFNMAEYKSRKKRWIPTPNVLFIALYVFICIPSTKGVCEIDFDDTSVDRWKFLIGASPKQLLYDFCKYNGTSKGEQCKSYGRKQTVDFEKVCGCTIQQNKTIEGSFSFDVNCNSDLSYCPEKLTLSYRQGSYARTPDPDPDVATSGINGWLVVSIISIAVNVLVIYRCRTTVLADLKQMWDLLCSIMDRGQQLPFFHRHPAPGLATGSDIASPETPLLGITGNTPQVPIPRGSTSAGNEMGGPIEPLDVLESDERGDTHIRPERVANLIVKPDFKLKKTQIQRDQMDDSESSTKHPIAEKINFDALLERAKRLFEENKNSIESPIWTVSRPHVSSDIESSKKLDLVRDSAARDSTDASIVWLFNSVAGAGKSTVLKEMAHQLSRFDERFKILQIPLKKYDWYLREMPALKMDEIKFLAKTTGNSRFDIDNWIEKREVIVFIDGFDEVCPDFREKIIKILIALNDARVPLFIGTRPHEVHHIQERIKNSTIVEIEPLDEEKQIEFLRIVARKNQREIKQLMNIFKDQDILGNPLYLSMLAEYSDDQNLYDIFDKMVRRKVEICLKRENGGKDVGEQKINKKLKLIQLVAFRFVRGVKIDQGRVSKEELEKINAFGVVTYFNEQVNFTHQVFAEFLTAQKCIYDLTNPVAERVPLFNDEMMQCRKFVELFFSTEKGMNEFYAEAFVDWAKSTEPLNLVRQICRENLSQMFRLLKPDLSLRDNDGKNALHFALRHLEMVKMVHEKNRKLATETTKDGENCLHLAIADEKCSEEVAIWILQNTEVDKKAETKFKDTPLLLACKRKKWEVVRMLVFAGVDVNTQDSCKRTALFGRSG